MFNFRSLSLWAEHRDVYEGKESPASVPNNHGAPIVLTERVTNQHPDRSARFRHCIVKPFCSSPNNSDQVDEKWPLPAPELPLLGDN